MSPLFKQITKPNSYCRDYQISQAKAVLASAQGYVGSPPSKVSALFYTGMLMSYHEGGAWYPEGGYQKMTDAFVKAFDAQGGELLLNMEVKKIIVEKGKAQGVELEDGRKIKSNLIVSNAETRRTFLDMRMDLESLDLNYGIIFVKKNYELENKFIQDEKRILK